MGIEKDFKPVALVTGATGGIGEAICHALSDTHRILVGGRNEEAVAKVVAALPDAEPFVCDLMDLADLERAASQVGRLDVLIHCAGVCPVGSFENTDQKTWLDTLQLNVVAIADLTRALLPKLRQSHGTLVTLNSNSGLVAKPGLAIYAASKFALTALTDVLREEERGKVKVVSIHPGRVDTKMQVKMQQDFGKETYHPGDHLSVSSVAELVKLCVLSEPNANIESVTIRPT